jgi:PLD-like domain
VFRVILSLGLSALAPAAPASSVAPGAAIGVCFSHEEDCAAFAIRAINNAESEILVSAYGLTTGSGIVEALLRAKQRGVDVRLIADRTTPCERGSGVAPLVTAGVPIWIDAKARIAHAKTIVIDGGGHADGFDELDPRRRSQLGSPQSRLVRGRRSGLRGPLASAPLRFGPVRAARGLVPDLVARSPSRSAAMSERRPSKAARLRRVTVRVPEDYAEGLREFAQKLRNRQQSEPAPSAEWRRLSPSAELMVNSAVSARCAVRDTRAPGDDRFRWTVAVQGQLEPVAEGWTENRAEARSLAEAAVAAYFGELSSGGRVRSG